MERSLQLTERLPGQFGYVAPILSLELDDVVRAPLAELRVQLGASFLARPVDAHVGELTTTQQRIEVPLAWQAAQHPRWFPAMHGRLIIADAGPAQIELRFVGHYSIPFGIIGWLLDHVPPHAARDSIAAYLQDVRVRLSEELARHAPPERPPS